MGEAAAGACPIGEDLVQLRHGSVAEGLCGRQLQQTSGMGALGSDGGSLVPGEQAQELHRLGAKPATDFNANSDKAAASGSGELWVRLMPFSPRGSG